MAVYAEREITKHVDLCDPNGRLNSDAVGWSRYPLHRCNLSGRWFSKKRWNYWAVNTEKHFFAISLSNRDYLGAAAIQVIDFSTGKVTGKYITSLLGKGVQMPETVEGVVSFQKDGLTAHQKYQTNHIEISVEASDFHGKPFSAHFDLDPQENHESLSVVIPWNSRTFQYTSKHNTIPASGYVRLGDEEVRFGGDDCFGTLDLGRGIWPRRFIWNWGAASGYQKGRLVGLNLGGKWTDGTNMNENGICIDGRLTKISEDLVWEYDSNDYMKPWRIYASKTGLVDLKFRPILERSGALKILFYQFIPFQMFGYYEGMIVNENGEEINVSELFGWAEEVYGQW